VKFGRRSRLRGSSRLCSPLSVTLGVVAVLALWQTANAEPIDTYQHLGVASCATGVCHGKLTEEESSNVWLNEYRIWSGDDRHARAYQTLLSDRSKAIARKLGLPNAQGAKICLDCHSDNVPQAQRGTKFQLSDGIGCEACHGGAEKWIESHTEPGVTHADNLANGMLGTEDINVRAQVCLSCHLGTANQFATHRIMGAGHPRLGFELEAYTANQPAHFAVDEDYIKRKGAPSGFEVWRAGQVESTRRYLQLMNTALFAEGDLLPDFSFYDCHSCHHPMENIRWPNVREQQNLIPGSLRLQDQNIFMLRALVETLQPDAAGELRSLHLNMLRAGQKSVPQAKTAAAALLSWLDKQPWVTSTVTDAQVKSLRAAIARLAGSGALADYANAEQAFLAIESLSFSIGDSNNLQNRLDALYEAVESDENFNAAGFRRAARSLADAL